ncbi:MAG: cytochrome c peroxidase [Flavobacteriales bacterium]
MNNLKSFLILFLIACIFSIGSCKRDEPNDFPVIPEPVIDTVNYDSTPYALEYGLFPTPEFNGNPLTVQGVRLGRMLFYETLLSRDNSISCSSCHQQEHGFSDPNQFSSGVDGSLGGRQAMSVFNTAWHRNEFFWDGRAHLLRDQALMPIQDKLEMKETLGNVVSKLQAEQDYIDQFERAFGDTMITSERISLALEQFMNSIVSNRSKYDDFLAGKATLSDSEERGRVLFFAEYNPSFPDVSGADCQHCHGGSNFDNPRYANNGLDEGPDIKDIGREKVTGDPKDRGAFKIPSLRNIEVTAPYMHDGRFTTLEQVVDHYDHGIQKSPSLDPALVFTTQTGLMLSDQDKIDLIAFLKTLTDQEVLKDARYSDPFK